MLFTRSTWYGLKGLLCKLRHLSAHFIYTSRFDISSLSAPQKVMQAHLTAEMKYCNSIYSHPKSRQVCNSIEVAVDLKRKGQITVMESIHWRLPREIIHPQGEKGSLRGDRRKHLHCKSNQLEARWEALWSLTSPVRFNQLQQLVNPRRQALYLFDPDPLNTKVNFCL